MSYWVYLCDDDGTVQVDNHSEGGTYVLGGTSDACVNVTYNYGHHYYDLLHEDGLRGLHGLSGAEAAPLLERAVAVLGTERDDSDYWAPTPGNAGAALGVLLRWAKQHPSARFDVS